MKYTLKNRPQYPDKTSGLTKRDYVRACIAYDDWLEGFEKELREKYAAIEKNKQQVLNQPEYFRPLEAIQGTIREVLGVEPKVREEK
jgi:hypothetical protein